MSLNSKLRQTDTPQQLNLKSIQPEEQLKSRNKNRPALDSKDKDRIKKRRKLLSFEQEIQQGSPEKLMKIKREKSSNRFEITIGGNKPKLEEDLKSEYLLKIQNLKEQLFEIDYSYWDGPLLVKKLRRKKKQTVTNLIQVCRLELVSSFQNLATCQAGDLIMVIKDFIVPLKMSIADIEALELKTAKGDLLLNFKNVKIKEMILSVNVDGPIRIVEKSKYEKNIGSYPFNTWRQMNVD